MNQEQQWEQQHLCDNDNDDDRSTSSSSNTTTTCSSPLLLLCHSRRFYNHHPSTISAGRVAWSAEGDVLMMMDEIEETIPLPQPKTLSDLPQELITQHLSRFLTFNDLLNLRLTNSLFNHLVTAIIWSKPHLPLYPKTRIEPFLAYYGPLIRHLTFPDPTWINLSLVSHALTHLVSIDFAGAAPFVITDNDVCGILNASHCLTRLILNDCVEITDQTMWHLSRYPNVSHLTHLHMDRCSNPTDQGLCSVLQQASRLQSLSINTVPLVGNPSLQALVTSCPLIEALGLSDCDDVSNETLAWLAMGLPRLHSLDISECHGRDLTTDGLLTFVNIRNELSTYDEYAKLSPTSDLGIDARAIRCGPRRPFTKLVFKSLEPLSDSFLCSLFTLPIDESSTNSTLLLQHLDISNLQPHMTPLFLTRLSESNPHHLTHLDMSHMVLTYPSLSSIVSMPANNSIIPLEQYLVTLFKTCPSLVTINLSGLSGAVPSFPLDLLQKVPAVPLPFPNVEYLQTPPASPDLLSETTITTTPPQTVNNNTIDPTAIVTDAVIHAIATSPSSQTLKHLDISECPAITDTALLWLSRTCTRLQDLNLKGCTQITDAGVSNLPSSLVMLNVGLCSKISDAGVARVNLTKLETLKLSGCFSVSGTSIDQISGYMRERLDSQSYYYQDKAFTNTTINTTNTNPTSMNSTCEKGLKLMCLSGCHRIPGSSLISLAQASPYLESLNLYACPSVTDTVVTQIAQHCPCLVSLVISKCPVGDEGLQSLGRYCQRLHTLYAGFLAPVGTTTSSASSLLFGYHHHHQHQHQRVAGDAGVKMILKRCPRLKLLDVSRCEGLTDAGFMLNNEEEEGFNKYLELQVLIARACHGISIGGVMSLVQRANRLQSVDVVGCAKIGVAEREHLGELLDSR